MSQDYEDTGDLSTAADFLEENWQAFIDLLEEKGHDNAEQVAEATVTQLRDEA